jgi:hypothetical protein
MILGHFNFFFLTCPHKREREIRTSDLRFIRRGPNRLNYFLRIWVIYVGFLEPLVEVGNFFFFIFFSFLYGLGYVWYMECL